MKPKRSALSVWQIPSVITGVVVVCGFLGTAAVIYVTYKNLPAQVEAVEQKNDAQDSAIDKLTAIQGTWQQIYQQQQTQQAPPPPWTFLRQEGDWQVFRDPAQVEQCCNGTTCVSRKKHC